MLAVEHNHKLAPFASGKAVQTREPATLVSVEPEQLAVLCKAFDAAWKVLRKNDTTSDLNYELERLRLADAVLAAHRGGLVDADLIQARALDLLSHS